MVRSTPVMKAKNTDAMISAAAMITRPIVATPSVIASRGVSPLTNASRMRLTRKTS